MELHESLAALARDHGRALFSDPGAFRGALDDYLDEGTASTGTINLLTDAVRLGALDSLLSMLDTGADPSSAVDTAGRRLARDRGSADTAGSQWAVAVLGYALGRVPESMAVSMHPDRATAQPPAPPSAPPPPATAVRPAQPAWPGPHQAGPPGQHGQAGQHGQHFGQPAAPYPPKKSRTGLVVALAAITVVLVVGVVIGVIALSGDDGGSTADDGGTTSEAATTGTTGGTDPTGTAATDTAPRDLGGPTITGDGYAYSVPEDWSDGTDDLKAQDGGEAIDSGALWGDSFGSARANMLVESATSFGQTDPEALKEDWITTLETSTGATPTPVDGITLGGQPTVGVDLVWENPNGITVHQVAYLAVHDGMQYSIAVTTRDGDTEALDAYQEILSTWVWQ